MLHQPLTPPCGGLRRSQLGCLLPAHLLEQPPERRIADLTSNMTDTIDSVLNHIDGVRMSDVAAIMDGLAQH